MEKELSDILGLGTDPSIKLATQELMSDVSHVYSFDCPVLDIPYGGGIYSGKVYEVFGWESQGKSTLALEFSKAFCRYWKSKGEKNYIVFWIETEEAFDKARAKFMGCDIDRYLIAEKECVEDAQDAMIEKLERALLKKLKLFIVWDTIAAAPTKNEKEKGQYAGGMMEKPRVIRAMLKKLVPLLAKTDSTLVLVNQVYSVQTQFGSSCEAPGGGGIKFHASVRSQITSKGVINKINPSGVEVVDGIWSELFHVKNKLTLPKKRSKVAIKGETGLDVLMTNIDFISQPQMKIVTVSGSWRNIDYPESVANPSGVETGKRTDPKMKTLAYQNITRINDAMVLDPHLKDWIDYIIYRYYTTESPLIKVKIIDKVWAYERKFYGTRVTKLEPREREIADLVHHEMMKEIDKEEKKALSES